MNTKEYKMKNFIKNYNNKQKLTVLNKNMKYTQLLTNIRTCIYTQRIQYIQFNSKRIPLM